MVFVLCGCQADLDIGVNVNANGSGSVTVTAHLDRDAASYAEDVQTSDLVKAGWTVTGPTPVAGGGVEITASKPFATTAAAAAVVSELSGSTGPFRDLSLSRRSSFFQTRTTFGGTADLTCGLNCFSDPQLQQTLGGTDDGIDPSELQADAGVIVDRILQFQVAVRLPGHVQSSNAPSEVGNGAVWKIQLGQKAVLMASSRAWNGFHIAAVVIGGLLVLVAAGVAAPRFRRRSRRARPSRPSP